MLCRPVRQVVYLAFLTAVLGSCGHDGSGSQDDRQPFDPEKPGLAFSRAPASAVLKGRFELRLRINDADGDQRTGDNTTRVTVSAAGSGTLGGTLERTAVGGFVRFDDLTYDKWETITLTVRASGMADAVTPPFPVRPVLRFAEMPPVRFAREVPRGPFALELVDARGETVAADIPVVLESTDPHVIVEGGRDRRLEGGRARFESIALQNEGTQSVSFRVEGLTALTHGVLVFSGVRVESLWLPPARVGAPYRAALPTGYRGFALHKGMLPAGLHLRDAEIAEIIGTPQEAQHHRFELSSRDIGQVETTWVTGLSVFDREDRTTQTLGALSARGPFPVGVLDDRVLVQVRGVSEALRIYYPLGQEGPAPGPFPVVVFHHGATRIDPGVTTLHDRYEPLLGHWASHGFIVASVDGTSLVFKDGLYVPPSIANLSLMAENQRATIAHLRSRAHDPAFLLAGRLDLGRIIVSGHSRGGGAAIISAHSNPSVMAMVLIKPLDPLAVAGGEAAWGRPLPPKPAVITVAGNDADVLYPMIDFVYERRSASTSLHTILGSLHNFSCHCPPERGGEPGIKPEEDWAVTNAYVVAFLKHVAEGDLGTAPLLFGPAGLGTRLASLGTLRRSDARSAAMVVDNFQDDQPQTNSLGLENYGTNLALSAEEPWVLRALDAAGSTLINYRQRLTLQPDALGYARARTVRSMREGGIYGTRLGVLDVSELATFTFRVLGEAGSIPADRLRVKFFDAEGRTATVGGEVAMNSEWIGSRFSDAFVPLSMLRAQGLDLDNLTQVELHLTGPGFLVIDDLRFE
jgi:hypothetical protein